jgi:hypothetical protein
LKNSKPERAVELPAWLEDILADNVPFRDFYITKGLGSGGTFASACWHYLMCLTNSKSKYSWHVSPSYTESLIVAIPEFDKVLTDVFGLVENRHYWITYAQPPRITFKWGQVIRFMSAQRYKKLVGATISHATGTEPGLFHEEVFKKVEARCRCPNAKLIQRFWEGTPEGMGNEYERLANFEEGVNEDTNARRVIVTTFMNKYLPEGFAQKLAASYKSDAGRLASYIYGIFKPFHKGTAYPNFMESINCSNDVDASMDDINLSFDWQASPLAWGAWQKQTEFIGSAYTKFERLVLVAESSGESRGIRDAVNEFKIAFPVDQFRKVPIHLWGGHDGFSSSIFSETSAFSIARKLLQEEGYQTVTIKAPRAAPAVRDRVEIVDQLFAQRMVKLGIWNRNTIKAYSETALKDGTWELKKERGKDTTHFSDASDYFLFHAAKNMNLDFTNLAKKTKKRGVNR